MANPLTELIVMGSHSVTCRSRQANTPRLNPSQASWYSICLPRMDGRLSWPRCVDSLIESLIPYTAEPTRHRDPSSLRLSSCLTSPTSVCPCVSGLQFWLCMAWCSSFAFCERARRETGSLGHGVTRSRGVTRRVSELILSPSPEYDRSSDDEGLSVALVYKRLSPSWRCILRPSINWPSDLDFELWSLTFAYCVPVSDVQLTYLILRLHYNKHMVTCRRGLSAVMTDTCLLMYCRPRAWSEGYQGDVGRVSRETQLHAFPDVVRRETSRQVIFTQSVAPFLHTAAIHSTATLLRVIRPSVCLSVSVGLHDYTLCSSERCHTLDNGVLVCCVWIDEWVYMVFMDFLPMFSTRNFAPDENVHRNFVNCFPGTSSWHIS